MTYLKHCEPWGDNHTNYRVVGKTPDDNSKSKVIIIKVLTNLLVLIIGYRRVWCKEAYSIKYLEKSLWHGHWQVRSAIDNLSLLLPGSFFFRQRLFGVKLYIQASGRKGETTVVFIPWKVCSDSLWLEIASCGKAWSCMPVYRALDNDDSVKYVLK